MYQSKYDIEVNTLYKPLSLHNTQLDNQAHKFPNKDKVLSRSSQCMSERFWSMCDREENKHHKSLEKIRKFQKDKLDNTAHYKNDDPNWHNLCKSKQFQSKFYMDNHKVHMQAQ